MSDTPPYSEATVELVAAAIASARNDDVFTEVEWNGSHWDTLRDAYRADARAALDVLAGRLLPEGAETRTEWAVWWLGPGGGIRLSQEHLTSQVEAEQVAATRAGDYGIVRWELRYREHRDFPDGSCWSGPWSAVPPEPKESPDA